MSNLSGVPSFDDPDFASSLPAPQRAQQPGYQGPISPGLRAMVAQDQLREDRQFMRRMQDQLQTSPDLAQELEELNIELGMDRRTIRDNIDKARQLYAAKQIERLNLARDYPILYRQLQDQEFAALAIDDFDKLTWLERWSAGWESANIMEELAEAANKLRAQGGTFRTEAEKENYMRLTKRMEDIGHVDGFWGMTGQTVSQMVIWETGVAIGAAIGAAFVPPAAPALVPLAIGLGGAAPAAYHTYELEGGLAYADYKQAGIAEDIARRNSHTVGLINAAIEMGTLAFFAKPFGAATRNLANRSGLTRRLLGNALDRPTATRAWRKTAGRSLASLSSEVGQEVAQENVTALGAYFGKKATEARDQVNEVLSGAVINMPGGGRVVKEDGKVRVTPDVFKRITGRPVEFLDSDGLITLDGDVGKRLLEDVREIYPIEVALNDETFWSDVWDLSIGTAGQAILGVGLISQFGPTLQHFSEMKRIRHAEEQHTAYKEVKENLKDSKLRQRSGSRMVNLLRKWWRGTKMDEVHIPREEFTKALDDVGLTVEEVDGVFPGLADQLAKTEEQQPTVVLDGATFFGEVAETELQDRLFEHIKPSANALTITERKAHEEKISAEVKRLQKGLKAAGKLRDAVDTDADELFEKLTQNALNAGVRYKQVARDAAALAVAGIRIRAEEASVAKGTLVLPSQLLAEMGIDADTLVIAKPEDYDTKTVFRQFAGKNAATADMPAFGRALQMAEDGASSDEIREATGWFVGPDGQARFEISDEHARIRTQNMPETDGDAVLLDDVFSHDELFAAYPELRQVKFRVASHDALRRVFPGESDPDYAAYWDGAANEIVHIAAADGETLSPRDLRILLLHEVQHAIQATEGFAGGAPGGEGPFIALLKDPDQRAEFYEQQLALTLAELYGPSDVYEDDYAPTLLRANSTEDDRNLLESYARARIAHAVAQARFDELHKKRNALGPLAADATESEQEARFDQVDHPWVEAKTEVEDAGRAVDNLLAEIDSREKQLDRQAQLSDADRAFAELRRELDLAVDRLLKESPDDLYMRTAGEAEARLTELRANLTPLQRQQIPYDTGLQMLEEKELQGPRDRANLVFFGPDDDMQVGFVPSPATSTKFRQGGLRKRRAGSVKAAPVPANGQFAPTGEDNLTASIATGKGSDLNPDADHIILPTAAAAALPASKGATAKNTALLHNQHKSASGTIKRQVVDPKTKKKKTVTEKTDKGGYDGVNFGQKKGMARAEVLIEFMVRNLKTIYNAVPEKIRRRSRLWYDGANRIARELADRYSLTTKQIAGMLAVTSPQADWRMNVSYVERIADLMQNGRRRKWSSEMDTWLHDWLYSEDAIKKREKKHKDRQASLARAEADLELAIAEGKGINAAKKTVATRRARLEAGDLTVAALKAIKGKTLGQVIKAGNPYHVAVWVRTFDEVYNDRGFRDISPEGQTLGYVLSKATGERDSIGWKSFGAIANAVSIYLDGSTPNISARLGVKHKVRNFYNNILTPNSAIPFVTSDTHQVAADLLLPLAGEDLEVSQNFGTGKGTSSTKATGLSGTYWMHQEAVIRAAAELGVLPRELQSISWEAVRGLFGEDWKSTTNTQEVRRIWAKYRTGKYSYDQAVKLIVKFAGGWSDPFWVAHPPSSAKPFEQGATTYEGPLSGSLRGRQRGSGAGGPRRGGGAIPRADGRGPSGARKAGQRAGRTRYRQTKSGPGAAAEGGGDRGRVVEGGTDALRDGDPTTVGNATVLGRLGDSGFEIAADEQGRTEFAQRMRSLLPDASGRGGNKFFASVTFKNPSDLEGAQLFMSPSGNAGVAISADGELQAGWSNAQAESGEAVRLMQAVLAGATPGQVWATSFATKLPELYTAIGFRPVSRTPFNREFAPTHPDTDAPIWDYGLYQPWQNGEPDVLFYVFDGEAQSYSDTIREGLPSFGDYDQAEAVAADRTKFRQRRHLIFDESDYRPEVVAWAKEHLGEGIAPNGRPIYQNFVEWFGDSKAVDENGHPLAVYHSGTFRRFTDVPREGMHFGTQAAAEQRRRDKELTWQDVKTIQVPVPKEERDAGVGIWTYTLNGEQHPETYATEEDAKNAAQDELDELNELELQAEDDGLLMTEAYLSLSNPKRVDDAGSQPGWDEEIEAAKREGHDGLVYINEAEDRGSTSWVVFEPAQAKSLDNDGDFDTEQGLMMRQQDDLDQDEGPRGEFDPESMQIILHKKHDPTTLVHELGHFFFELDTKMANAGIASAQQLQDLETVLDELGENEFDSLEDYLSADPERRRELHEKVAYNFEVYMYEGKAPSAALKDVFRRMSKWMVRIYRQVRDVIAAHYYAETYDEATGKGKQLPALTDAVRNVFDRWLAADEEIELRIREEAIGRLLRADADIDELDKILLQEIVFEHEHEAKEKLREVLLTELKKLRTMRGRMVRKAQRDSRAERRKREAEERQRIASGDRVGRLLHFMSTGELLNEDGTVNQSSLQARLEGALNRLYLLMVEQKANKDELATRQPELDATIADSEAQIADKREGIAAVRKELKLLRKAGGDQTARIDESLEFIATAEAQIQGLERTRKAAREELKALNNEIKRVDKSIQKAHKSVAVAQKGAEGVKGKRLKMFLTDDPRVPEQYRTTDPDKAEIVDVERFARQNGYGSADVMFDALRRQMVGEKKQAIEVEAGGVKYRLPGDPAGEALQDMVNDRTDERMLAEVPHLADESQMQFEIDAAMTNEAIVRMRAIELRMMEKQPLAQRRRTQEMVRVAREIARVDVGNLTTQELFGRQNVVRKFTQQAQAAERRAAANRGDVEAMAQHQRTALYFRAMAEQAADARKAIESQRDKLAKRLRFQPRSGKHEDQLARTYGGAVVETARQMLDMVGVEVGSGVREQGPAWQNLPEDSPERQMLEQADSDMRMVVATDGELMQQSVEQAMESLDYVEGVLMQGKWARMFELEGKVAELDDIIRQLREQVEAEAVPERSRKAPKTAREKVKGKIRKWNYTTQRVEQLLYALDGDQQGLLSQLIFVPLRNAEDKVEIHLAAVIEKLAPLLQTVRDEVGSSRELSQPITTGTDATGAPLLPDRSKETQDADVLDSGKLDVLGMLLHCGNESNLRRLLLGFGWGKLRPDGSVDTTRWWEQVRQWEEAGVITAADWEFCQGVWDIYEEELLPMTQEAHYEMLGRRMALVDKGMPVLRGRVMADGTVVNVAGGYVPAGRDPQLRSPKGERNEQDTLLGFQRSIATINKGHTKDRVDEDDPDPLDINPINQILHFRQSIIFAQMGPAHKKVATLLRNDEFSKLLERMSPGIYQNVLDPLMETAATLSSTLVAARGADMLDGLDFVDKLRSNYGTAAMFANVVNSLQGVTGVLLAGMSGQVKWRYLAEGMGSGHTKSEIYKLSPFMATRHKLGVSAFEMQQQVLSLVESGAFQSVKEAQRWLAKNTYWMQEIIQHPVDLIVWRGAYAQAIAEGKTSEVAVNAADGAVRRTQADTAVTSMAKIEKGGRFAKMWTQFLSWFLSLGSMRASAMRRATLQKRETDGTRAMWVLRVIMSKEAMAGFFTLYVGELIATALRGDDEEKDAVDTWLVDPLLMTSLAIPRALGPVGAFGATVAARGIPLVVPSLSRDLEYQQRMPAPGAIAILDQIGRTTKNLLQDDADRSDVLDALELGAKIVGIPLHVLTQRARRGLDIFDEEKIEPQGVSLVTGRR